MSSMTLNNLMATVVFQITSMFHDWRTHFVNFMVKIFLLKCRCFCGLPIGLFCCLYFSSRFINWKLCLYTMLFLTIVLLPFYIAYFVVGNISFSEYQWIWIFGKVEYLIAPESLEDNLTIFIFQCKLINVHQSCVSMEILWKNRSWSLVSIKISRTCMGRIKETPHVFFSVPHVDKTWPRTALTFACWLVFLYFFWKIGDPFPILSPKHGEKFFILFYKIRSVSWGHSCQKSDGLIHKFCENMLDLFLLWNDILFSIWQKINLGVSSTKIAKKRIALVLNIKNHYIYRNVPN